MVWCRTMDMAESSQADVRKKKGEKLRHWLKYGGRAEVSRPSDASAYSACKLTNLMQHKILVQFCYLKQAICKHFILKYCWRENPISVLVCLQWWCYQYKLRNISIICRKKCFRFQTSLIIFRDARYWEISYYWLLADNTITGDK